MKTLFIKKGKAAKQQSSKVLLSLSAAFFTLTAMAQEPPVKEQDTLPAADHKLDEVLVQAVRSTSQTPVTFSNVSKQEIAPRNLGQDIPVLLGYLPSVVTTTDAGNGIGYTSMRVRGADASRINVTLNGIPYNDAESQGTFWVNMGDFASSVENIQLQRGVGTSTNGAGAFGASLNLLSDAFKHDAGGEVSSSYGSFNSMKNTVKFTTGLLGEHFELSGRLSDIRSDGYIDRAASHLKSYFLQGAYVSNTTLIKALVFGGQEKTYQAWNGIDGETMAADRRFNSSGMYTDENGDIHFYKNETDNYQQDHAQLLWNEKVSGNWSTNVALHYTKGKGYYENYQDNTPISNFPQVNPTAMVDDYEGNLVPGTDLITRKWLDNDFYGTTFSANYKDEALNFVFGGAWNKYEGEHFGNIIWAENSGGFRPDDKYYDNNAKKTDFNIYAKANYQLNTKLNLYGDLQYRRVHYDAQNVLEDWSATQPVDDTFNFFNPKAGITYTVDTKNNIYASYGRGNKEPRRGDYESGSSKPESLNDFELGWRYKQGRTTVNLNGYYMRYKDQLVLTGRLNDVGSPIYTNSGDSYRLGFEADIAFYALNWLVLKPNVAVSTNKNIDFYNQTDAGVQNLGNTNIAFSPNIIAGNQLIVLPFKNFQATLLSKYVGEQYMDNLETPGSKLKDYFVNDINVTYEFKNVSFFKSIVVSGLINNVFDKKYASNGYMYGTTPYYYPQAGINVLGGVTFKF